MVVWNQVSNTLLLPENSDSLIEWLKLWIKNSVEQSEAATIGVLKIP